MARAGALNVCSVHLMSSSSSPVQAVVAIYTGPLQGVRFADIDSDSLAHLATEVESITSDVEKLEAQLASLRSALAQKEESLLVLTQQALAYARIYAENDETLTAELNAIALPRATKPRKNGVSKSPERKARAPKEEGQLGADSAGAGAEAELETVAAAAKSKRKAPAVAVESDKEAIATRPGRRKLPTRTGRAAR